MTTQDPHDDLPQDVMLNTHRVLKAMEIMFERPQDALFAGILSVAVMAHAVGMPLETLLDGLAKAYRDLRPVDKEEMQ